MARTTKTSHRSPWTLMINWGRIFDVLNQQAKIEPTEKQISTIIQKIEAKNDSTQLMLMEAEELEQMIIDETLDIVPRTKHNLQKPLDLGEFHIDPELIDEISTQIADQLMGQNSRPKKGTDLKYKKSKDDAGASFYL